MKGSRPTREDIAAMRQDIAESNRLSQQLGFDPIWNGQTQYEQIINQWEQELEHA